MLPSTLADAPAVIFDPVRGNMQTTRAVLHGVGFRRIDGTSTLSELKRRLRDVELSVAFVDATDEPEAVINLIRAQRMGEIGINPFLPILATLWNGQSQLVADLMNAGADDVVLRPLSSATAGERVRALVAARKPFVVTSDYVGPDRSERKSRDPSDPKPFDAPNPLRARVMGESSNPVQDSEALKVARRKLDKERLSKLARRIAMAAEVTIQANGGGDETSGFVIDLIETTAELLRAARRLDQDEIQDIAAVLENVVARAAMPGPERVENAQLTRQLALALFAAYASEDSDAFRSDLEETLTVVRSRLDRAKKRLRHRHLLALSLAS